jgi:hypothetical protein
MGRAEGHYTMQGMLCFFNQRIESWNTSAVTNMGELFKCAYQFDQPLNR